MTDPVKQVNKQMEPWVNDLLLPFNGKLPMSLNIFLFNKKLFNPLHILQFTRPAIKHILAIKDKKLPVRVRSHIAHK